MNFKPRFTTAMGLCLVSGLWPLAVQASEHLPDMLVTGTRSAYSIDKLPDTATIFTRQQIELSQAKTLPELLQGSAGIDITTSGGFGTLTNISLRGTNSGHVLVLVDGLKVSSATSGTTAIQHFPIDQIERIEIVRGPHSSVFGSEAIGGVIQIFTRKGQGATRYDASVGYGTDSTWDGRGAISGSHGDTNYSVAASWFDTRGFDAQNPGLLFFANEPDDDGYRNQSVTARIGHRFNDSLNVDLHVLRADADTEFDGAFTNFSETVQQVIGGAVHWSPSSLWQTSLRLGESRDKSTSLTPAGLFSNRFDTKRRELNWQNTFNLNEQHSVIVGVDYHDEDVVSSTAFTIDERQTTGVFAEYLASMGVVDLVASVRNDNTDSFGSHKTGRVGLSIGRFGGVRLFGSYGTGFKEPTFNDLYFPLAFGFVGNPNLLPEKSRSFELGVDGKHDWGEWTLRAYRTRIRDLIALNGSFTTVVNINQAHISGMEAEYRTEFMGWNTQMTLSALDAVDAATGNRLPRRADRTLRIDMSRDFGQWRTGGTFMSQSDRFDDSFNTTPVDGYAIVNLRGEYIINSRWSLSGHINNLLNNTYETINGFNEPGRYAMLYINFHSH